jgi:hypothetical protein
VSIYKGIIREGDCRVARRFLYNLLRRQKALNNPCSACPGPFEGHLPRTMAVLFFVGSSRTRGDHFPHKAVTSAYLIDPNRTL